MNPESQSTLKEFRAAIKEVWLRVVGRSRLTSSEYDLIIEWFGKELPLSLILKAIQQVAERARRNKTTIYSLGVIRADLTALLKQQASSQVGGHKSKKESQWRAIWEEDLKELIEGENNPRRAALYTQLLEDLPGLAYDQAKARWHEAQNAL